MLVIHSFDQLRSNNLQILNSANVVLVPKKEGAEGIGDFRPISLIHGIGKLISKVLALRLQPHMGSLISQAQSAFIKKRSIHDNFMYVRNLARKFHQTRTPALLLKLDISKAFDSVRWDYLIDLLQRRGFTTRWTNWITNLLISSTSRALLNGCPGIPIKHGRGLRQGDPLSPLLFILAIDPFHHLLEKATNLGLLSTLRGRAPRFRTSLYADDAAIFVNPSVQDMTNLTEILRAFGGVSGLRTNMSKSQIAPIRCGNIDLTDVTSIFPAALTSFPMKYLGLPLVVGRLKKVHIQPLIDKCQSRLAPWQGRLMSSAARICLTKSVLTAQPIYHLTSLKLPDDTLKDIDKIRRKFLWAGGESISDGKCKVNWKRVCRPKDLGGLGVMDLQRFTSALRLRWLWNEWVAPDKLWVGMSVPCSLQDKELFSAATTITVGNGKTARFWDSRWLENQMPQKIAPNIFLASKRKNRTVHDAI